MDMWDDNYLSASGYSLVSAGSSGEIKGEIQF